MREYEKNKVDLHLHLDGSLPVGSISHLAEMAGVELEDKPLTGLFSVPQDCRSLVDYLKCFELPGKLLQLQDCLSYACEALVRELYSENVLTCEIRFAPQFHHQLGLSNEQIVEAVLDGMQKGLHDCPGMKCGLILCMMVGGADEENMATVETAHQYLGQGVVALDLAGAEGSVPMLHFESFFHRASQYDIPFTIHAGECGDYRNIETALDFGAVRIGHGVAAAFSEKTLDRLVRTQTPIEVCVTSNLQTCAIPVGVKHPVKQLLDAGVRVTINTDNRTVSGTNLSKEYALLQKEYGFQDADILKTQEFGRGAAFC